jgi:3-deoxy-D-manno-octulosonic-acid transferase
MLALYRLVSTAAGPLVRLFLERRCHAGKEDRTRMGERFGESEKPRPEGPLIWLHAASVGESAAALPLIERLLSQNPELHVLVTTGTVTSAKLLKDRLPRRAFHQFVPVDLPYAVRRFLDHWRPDLTLWMESEFWPNLLRMTRQRGVPMVLVNARISPHSHTGWRRFPRTIEQLLSSFELCLGQNQGEAERLMRLGAVNVVAPGNLKFAVPPLPAGEKELAKFRKNTTGRTLWLASSTHPGEEEIAARAHREMCADFPGLLTVIVPRHITRGAAITRLLRGEGMNVAQRSAGEALTGKTDIYVADTMGELGLFYRLAPVVFLGGSLVTHGGQNPIEPGQLDCAIVIGPHIFNFLEIATDMRIAGAVLQINDAHALAGAVGGLIRDPKRSGEMAAAAKRIAVSGGAVLDHIMEVLAPFTAPLMGTKGGGKNEKNGESGGDVTTAAETSCART